MIPTGGAIAACAWPASRLGEALRALGVAAGLGGGERATPPAVPQSLIDDRAPGADARLARWLDGAAAGLGLEIEAAMAADADLVAALRSAAPALVRLPGGDVVLISATRRRRLVAVAPTGAPVELVAETLADALRGPPPAGLVELVDRAGLGGAARARALAGLRRRSARPIPGLWLVRTPPSAPLGRLLREAGALRAALRFAALEAGHLAAFIASWWLLGRAALSGRLDEGWLTAWALLLVTAAALRVAALAAQGRAATLAGMVLRTRVLAGALRLDLDATRADGVGRHLGRALDAAALETLALGGGAATLAALVQAVAAPFVLGAGAAAAPLVVAQLGFSALAVIAGVRLWRRRLAAADAGLHLTHELIERLVGHRTRLVQEPRERWQDGLDDAMAHLHACGRAADRTALAQLSWLPRSWLVVALALLAPAFIGGAAASAIAVSVGGILLAQRALRGLGDGLGQVIAAAVAWRQVAPLFEAAARPTAPGVPALALVDPRAHDPILEVRDASFRHRGRAAPVLDGLNVAIRRGDRVLLEGRSGAGKSTLASLLLGLRTPERGLVLLGGLDRATVGDADWRRHVGAAPQFHENHVFAETFAWNALLGRGWPPTAAELAEAEALCRELGLGPLLDRMPAGMQQMVGDMGWQLSHGERSRLYIARALLSGAEVIVLDESFAALDPETLAGALAVVERRASTLVVIAHP